MNKRNSQPVTGNPQLPTPNRNPQPVTRNSKPATPTVVVVEDDAGLNRLACKRLEEHGFRAVGVHDGAAAIARLKSEPDALLLLDYVLPDIDGRQLVEGLATRGHQVPFIVMTGRGDERLAVEMMKLGARDYVVKEAGFLEALPQTVEKVVQMVAAEKKLAATEQLLRESEERLRKFSQTAPDAIVMANDEGKIDFWNEAAERVFGWSKEEAAGRFLPELVAPPALRERFRAGLAAFARTGTGPLIGRLMQFNAFRRDGTEFPVELTMTAMRLQGRWHAIGTIRDVTKRKQAEEALQESEEKYRTVVERANDAIIIIQDGICRFANTRANSMWDVEGESIVGSPFTKFVHPDSLPLVRERYERRMAGQDVPPRYEVQLVRADGSSFPAELNAGLATFAGRPADLVVVRDMTERKQAEAALYATGRKLETERNRLRGVLDGMPDLVYIVNRDCDIEYVNPAMERTYGAPRGRKCYDYFTGSAQICPDCPNEKVFAGEAVQREVRTQQGVTYDVFSAPLANPDGSVSKLGTLHDITELKQAQEHERELLRGAHALRDTAMELVQMGSDQEMYRFVAERVQSLVPDSVVAVSSYDPTSDLFTIRAIAGLGGALETVLRALGRRPEGTAFRLSPEEKASQSTSRLRDARTVAELSLGELPRKPVQGLARVLGLNDIHTQALYHRGLVSGSVVVATRRGSEPVSYDTAEAFVGQAAIAIQRWQAEQELAKHRLHLEELVAERTRELEAAQGKLVLQEKLATLGRVAGSVAHELRNPLATIRNASFLLRTALAGRLEPTAARHLKLIDEYVERANRAITMILDFTWQQRSRPKPCALRPILDRAVADTAVPPTVKVLFDLRPDLPEVEVDNRQTAAVFRNLLTNAVQAMPSGGTVRISAGTRNAEVVITVSDTGSGIEPEHMQRLFEPLFTTKSIGVGLGLAICKAFVEANKGTISVASEIGKGTVFTVTLPIAERETMQEG